MRLLTLALLVSSLAATGALAAPRKAPPPAPPKGRGKLPTAKRAPAGKILTLKPGQTRLTPEQMKALGLAPKTPPKAKASRKK